MKLEEYVVLGIIAFQMSVLGLVAKTIYRIYYEI